MEVAGRRARPGGFIPVEITVPVPTTTTTIAIAIAIGAPRTTGL